MYQDILLSSEGKDPESMADGLGRSATDLETAIENKNDLLLSLDLATSLAGRLCHDFISPTSAIISGLDLLDDSNAEDMREDAMQLIRASSRKLGDLLTFARSAFGSTSGTEIFAAKELQSLIENLFTHAKPTLDWQVEVDFFPKSAARILLNLAQIGVSALPLGGSCLIKANQIDQSLVIILDAKGRKAKLRPETLQGFSGKKIDEGLSGHWVQAYYVYALVHSTGGTCSTDIKEDQVILTANLDCGSATG